MAAAQGSAHTAVQVRLAAGDGSPVIRTGRMRMAQSDVIDLAGKFDLIADHWSPRIIARVNETAVKVAKLKGAFDWHHHEAEDELFWVIHGRLLIQFRDRDVWLEPGQMLLVPRGVEHRPVAPEEVHIVMIEPATTLNTGNIRNDRTVETVEEI
jgi:mannose-6-phosphate isomerase-like protein (cupin superfamily)